MPPFPWMVMAAFLCLSLYHFRLCLCLYLMPARPLARYGGNGLWAVDLDCRL